MDKDSSSLDPDIIEALKGLETQKAEYPPELLAVRRAAFMEQIERRAQVLSEESLTPGDERVVTFLGNLKTPKPEYPAELLAARRSTFRKQVAQIRRVSVWDAFSSWIRNLFARRATASARAPLNMLRTSLTVAGLALAAIAGLILYTGQSVSTSPIQDGVAPVGHMFLTPTPKAAIICKDGFEPPLCLAKEVDKSHDLTYPGNGNARPAVAKDTMPGYGKLHRAENVNDGLYGPGASWISNSPNSWIKIDLGKVTAMNTVTFGRDRLGNFNDGDPGRFVIAVATSDDVYANGNSSNDEREYADVYDSAKAGFDGTISGAETVIAQFNLLEARYVKITFENARTAIDEVEVFVTSPSERADVPTRKPDRDLPSSTLVAPPSGTAPSVSTATLLPSDTPVPTDTAIPVPTDTAFVPTDTPKPTPTDTPKPISTATPFIPTDTPVPMPTDTSVPADTHIPPTDVLLPTPVDPQILPP